MFCSKCGNQLKEGEQFCSKCGTPAGSDTSSKVSGNGTMGIPPMFSTSGFDGGKTEEKSVSAGEKVQGTISKVLTVAGEKVSGLWERVNGISLGEKTAGLGKKPVVIGLAAVVILVLGFANGARIGNLLYKTFSSPAKYYQYVEKKTVKELTSNTGEWYDSYVLDGLNVYDKSVSGEFEVELGEEGQELLGLLGLAGVDLSWLQSASVSATAAAKDNVTAVDASLKLNKSSIFSGNAVMDAGTETAYVRIPEINPQYIGVETGMLGYVFGYRNLYGEQEFIEKLVKACPSQAEAEKLAGQYLRIALKCVDDVTKSKDTLRVEGIEQKCTVLKVQIDSRTIADMAKAVVKEAKDDKKLKKIITNLMKASYEDLDAEEAYDYFLDMLDDLEDELKQDYYADGTITMKVYVNGKGEVIGRSLDLGYMTLKCLMPEKGKKYGCELSGQMGNMKISLAGNGKKSGDRIKGDFRVKYNGASILDLTVSKLNIKDLKKGQLNGSVVAKMSSKISSLIGYVPGLSAIEDIQLSMDFDSSKNSHKCKLGILYDDQDVGNISLSVKTGNGSKASIPSAKDVVMIEDLDDIEEWTESINTNKLVSSLKSAGLPSDITDMLEEISDELEDADVSDLMSMMYRWYY